MLTGLAIVTVRRTTTHTLAAGLSHATDADADRVRGAGSTLPLVVFGGQGDDTIEGGRGGDLVLGDRGRVLWFTPAGLAAAGSGYAGRVLDAADLVALEALAGAVAGHGGPGDRTDGVDTGALVGLLMTTDPRIGGNDTLLTGAGSDLVLGGAGGDMIASDSGATVDATDIVLGDHGYLDFVLLDRDAADLDRVTSTDVAEGGNDVICTGTGSLDAQGLGTCSGSAAGDGADLVFGGTGGDVIWAGSGENVVLGDNGSFTALPAATATWGSLPMSAGVLTTFAPTVGGNDIVITLGGTDTVVGGAGDDYVRSGAGTDTVVGDHATLTWAVIAGTLQLVRVEVIDNAVGGNDTAYGEAGEDVLVGGTRDDDLDGGPGRDLIFGDNVTLDRATTFGTCDQPALPAARRHADLQHGPDRDRAAGTALVGTRLAARPARRGVWGDYRITLPTTTDDEAAGWTASATTTSPAARRTTRSSASSATTPCRATATSTTPGRRPAASTACSP